MGKTGIGVKLHRDQHLKIDNKTLIPANYKIQWKTAKVTGVIYTSTAGVRLVNNISLYTAPDV